MPEGASPAWSTGTSRSTVPGRATAALTSRPCCFTPTTSSRPGKRCGNAHWNSAAWRGPRCICATSACGRWNGHGGTVRVAPTTHVSWPSPKPCCTTVQRKARDLRHLRWLLTARFWSGERDQRLDDAVLLARHQIEGLHDIVEGERVGRHWRGVDPAR